MNSYLKFLSRNKLYTAIEAVGLVVSLAFVIIIGSYVWQQYAVTRENPDRERIYVPGTPNAPGLTFGFPDVITRIPEIEEVARFCRVGTTYGKNGNENIICEAVEGPFFRMFPCYQFIEGGPDVLSLKTNVIVSESFANEKGLSVGDGVIVGWEEYTVGAIFKDLEGTVMRDYDLFLSSEIFKDDFEPFDDDFGTLCFIKARVGTERQVLYDKLEAVCKEVYPSVYGQSFFDHLDLYRYDELYFRDTGGRFKRGDIKTIRTLLLVGLLLLLSSIFNYINLSAALTGKRAKEMAVRQLHGASRGSIVIKYIWESILFTAICFAAGLLLSEAFCPMMNRLLNDPSVPIRIAWSPGYILAYAGAVVLVGIICGVIPAMISGRYDALDVMKGGYRRKTKMVFSKVFIVLQNALAVTLIALAIIMEAQMRKTQNRLQHCDIQNKVFLSFFAWDDKAPLKDALEKLPCVKRVGTCDGVPGFRPGIQNSKTKDGQDIRYRLYRMDSTAFQMFNFEILEDFNAPVFNSVWFSDESYAASGFDADYHDISILAQRTTGCEQLAGVFKAFPTNNSNIGEEDHAIISVVRMENPWDGSFLVETIGNKKEAYTKIMETYDAFAQNSNISFNNAIWVDDHIAEAWKPAQNNMRLLEVFMSLSIILSLLGLVAMSTYYADEKAHDIAVRKVFGGTVDSEVRRTIRDYMVLVGIACIIGIPIAVWAARHYLESYIYRLENYWWIFVLAVVLTFAMAFFSVLWQTLKAARTNPTVELKKE